MPCYRQSSATEMPDSASFSMPIIWGSVYRDCFIVDSLLHTILENFTYEHRFFWGDYRESRVVIFLMLEAILGLPGYKLKSFKRASGPESCLQGCRGCFNSARPPGPAGQGWSRFFEGDYTSSSITCFSGNCVPRDKHHRRQNNALE